MPITLLTPIADLPPLGTVPPGVAEFHRKLEGYVSTELRAVPELGAQLGAPGLLVKLELQRFGLPAFKFLGASYAAYRAIEERYALPAEWSTVDELRAALAGSGARVVTATDGNHGRAAARFAAMVGLAAKIYVPTPTAAARTDAIAGEGAEVVVVAGDYDDAVRRCAEDAGPDDVIVSDTSWEGYDTVPEFIVHGYSTIFSEIDQEVSAGRCPAPTSVLIPTGVGAFAAAAAQWLSRTSSDAKLILVEPTTAACVTAALIAGVPVTVPDSGRSSMAGLNCGTGSPASLLQLDGRTAATVTITDADMEAVTRQLAAVGIDAGESGAASVGAVAHLCAKSPALAADLLGAHPLAIITEAPTDPVNFERIVGRPPR